MKKIVMKRKPEKVLGFTSKIRKGRATVNTGFFIWPNYL